MQRITRRLFIQNTATALAGQLTASIVIVPVVQPKLKAWYDWLVRTMCDWTPHTIDA